jgi:hypothetical protein
MEGQVTTVRIITDQWLRRPHRLYRYKYEVVEEENPDLQRVDEGLLRDSPQGRTHLPGALQ